MMQEETKDTSSNEDGLANLRVETSILERGWKEKSNKFNFETFVTEVSCNGLVSVRNKFLPSMSIETLDILNR